MRLTSKWMVWLSAALMLILGIGVHAPEAGAINVGIVNADIYPPTSELMATGLFTSVTALGNITPTLAVLNSYDAILSYSNNPYANPTGLGNVLADYVDGGGGLVLATYSFSSSWTVGGRITTSGYSPLIIASTGDVSGTLTAVVPGDPIFAGVNLAGLTYFHNYNFAHPGLDAGATLLAKDASNYNMIARNSNGLIIGMNLFPWTFYGDNNGEFYKLLGNSLVSVTNPVPIPGAVWLLGSGLLGLVGLRKKLK
jgi:hypothetical protein